MDADSRFLLDSVLVSEGGNGQQGGRDTVGVTNQSGQLCLHEQVRLALLFLYSSLYALAPMLLDVMLTVDCINLDSVAPGERASPFK